MTYVRASVRHVCHTVRISTTTFVFLPLLHNPTQTLSTAQSRFNASCCTTPLYCLTYLSSGDARATFELSTVCSSFLTFRLGLTDHSLTSSTEYLSFDNANPAVTHTLCETCVNRSFRTLGPYPKTRYKLPQKDEISR